MSIINEDIIKNQVEENMKKAWCKLIYEQINNENPNFEYIISLYKEIKNRFLYILNKESKKRKDIEEFMDVDLFIQMITTDNFNRNNLLQLSNFLFDLSLSLCSPVRDKEIIKNKNEISNEISNEINILKTIPKLFLYINIILDDLYNDLHNYLNLK